MSDYLECAAGDSIRDQHIVSCDGLRHHEGEFPDEELPPCTGCVPKPANFGCLCSSHWYRLVDAITEWSVLESKLDENDVLSPRDGGATRSPAGPRLPLPQTFLAADEVRSWLTGAPLDARSWVSTIDGAVQAVGFTKAVERATRAHVIEEKPRTLQRVRCADCQQLVVWMPPTYAGDEVTVQCTNCGRVITEDEKWTAYRKTADGFEKYEEPALDVISRIETTKGRTA